MEQKRGVGGGLGGMFSSTPHFSFFLDTGRTNRVNFFVSSSSFVTERKAQNEFLIGARKQKQTTNSKEICTRRVTAVLRLYATRTAVKM